MDEPHDPIAEKVQALSDIELAVLVCLVADQHCIIETDKQLLDEVEHELRIVRQRFISKTGLTGMEGCV